MDKETIIGKPVAGRWVVVNTQANREQFALEHLARQDFETYCPMILKRIRHARRTRDVARPMFPGYLFVMTDPEQQRWRPIKSTRGVRTLVCCGDAISYLDERFIASLKARELNGTIVKPSNPFKIGQRVQLAGGPFDGLVASIIEMDAKDRFRVLMDLLNGQVKVHVEQHGIVAV